MSAMDVARTVSHSLPIPVRHGFHAVIEKTSDIFNPDLPPSHVRKWISPLWFDFKKTGRDQLEFFIELAGLKSSDNFLDIACGVGRLAVPLTRYLSQNARYEGFDIEQRCIKWCEDNISKNHPNFHFSVCNVKTTWSPNARYDVEEYIFPYNDAYFDFCYAGSIFTHILPGGAANYLKQVARVLKPGGRFVATWLIYNKESQKLIPGAADLAKHWKHDHGDYRTKQNDIPEASVAYNEPLIRNLYRDAGLTIAEPIRLDASYCPARIPENRSLGMHLHYSCGIIAVRE